MRADNIDFVLVGPPWLAVLTFGLLAVVHGMTVAALAGRYSRSLPLITRHPGTLLRYTPVLLLFAFPPIGLVAVAVGLVFVLLSRLSHLPTGWSSRLLVPGRIAVGLLALAALPGFAAALIGIP